MYWTAWTRAVLPSSLTTPSASSAEVLACSSAGGGLRIAVVGNEELVTAEAGRRVALSSGGKVVAVLGRTSPDSAFGELDRTTRPDVVLLTGGTDDGDEEGILDGARRLAASGWQGPVVVAGNVAATRRGRARCWPGGRSWSPTTWCRGSAYSRPSLPAGRSARCSWRTSSAARGSSSRADFTAMVQGATPDLVLTGVEVLARVAESDVVVVDIGGATTDVHSVVRLDPEDAGLSREVVATTPVTRTVEGDLGMRWSAVTTWEAGHEAGLLDDDSAPAVRRTADPSFLPTTDTERREDELIASAAATLALRRHVGRSRVVVGPDGRVVERTGKDLREVALLVGSGGVLRHSDPESAVRILGGLVGISPEGWQLPEHPRVVVDHDYVLAAVGLLSERRPRAAAALARSLSTCVEDHAS